MAHAFLNEHKSSTVPLCEVDRYAMFAGVVAKTAQHCEDLDGRVAHLEAVDAARGALLGRLYRESVQLKMRAMNQFLELSLLATEYMVPIDEMAADLVRGIMDIKRLHDGSGGTVVARSLRSKLADPEPCRRVMAALAPISHMLAKLRLAASATAHSDPADDESSWSSLFEDASSQLSTPDARRAVRAYVDARRAAGSAGLADMHAWMDVDPRGL